jgi:hypothetical protein
MGNKAQLLLNSKEVKACILRQCQSIRPEWDCTRVSNKVLDDLNYKLTWYITQAVKRHPTRGKTFTELY